MTLEEFRRTRTMTHDGLAALLGIVGRNPARTVQRYCAGRVPAPDVILRIQASTGGLVRPQDWYGDAAPEDAA